MTKIFFGGKQFFLRATGFLRELLAPFRITPARFNMMMAIAAPTRPAGCYARPGVAQHDLISLLGVTSATICRMLKSLEDLRLIIRTPHPDYSRRYWVAVTASGLYTLRAAIDEIVESSTLAWSVRDMLGAVHGRARKGIRSVRTLDVLLTRARRDLGDIATLQFPYDDLLSKLPMPGRLAAVEERELERDREMQRQAEAARRSRADDYFFPLAISTS